MNIMMFTFVSNDEELFVFSLKFQFSTGKEKQLSPQMPLDRG